MADRSNEQEGVGLKREKKAGDGNEHVIFMHNEKSALPFRERCQWTVQYCTVLYCTDGFFCSLEDWSYLRDTFTTVSYYGTVVLREVM